jgi:hypothetical protein
MPPTFDEIKFRMELGEEQYLETTRGEKSHPESRVGGEKYNGSTTRRIAELGTLPARLSRILITGLVPPPSNHLTAYLSRVPGNCKIITSSQNLDG